jgi:hypothetical protein
MILGDYDALAFAVSVARFDNPRFKDEHDPEVRFPRANDEMRHPSYCNEAHSRSFI